MGNRRLPTIRHQPRSQKAGHHPKGFARPISERNLIFSYELETWWLAGCRHDQQQALSRRRGSKWICVPIDCLQRLLGHGHLRRLRAVLAKVPYSIRQSSSSGSRSFMAPTIHSERPKRRAPLPPDSCARHLPKGRPGFGEDTEFGLFQAEALHRRKLRFCSRPCPFIGQLDTAEEAAAKSLILLALPSGIEPLSPP